MNWHIYPEPPLCVTINPNRFGDEADERTKGINTKTLVLSVANLQTPTLVGFHSAPQMLVIDHNQYIIGNHVYQVCVIKMFGSSVLLIAVANLS
jgi:hypothetical protein